MDEYTNYGETQDTTPEKREFRIHFMIYVIVIAALAVINLLTSSEHLWFIWPMLGWGIGVLFHAASTFGWFCSNR